MFPIEILDCISQYLTLKDAIEFMKVSKLYYVIINNNLNKIILTEIIKEFGIKYLSGKLI